MVEVEGLSLPARFLCCCLAGGLGGASTVAVTKTEQP